MEIRELRIGNLILFNQNEGVVDEIYKNNERSYRLLCSSLYVGLPIESCSPILLNNEWLVKFGFEFADCSVNGVVNVWRKGKFKIWDNKGKYSYFAQIDIKSVHQLQNLYYALTGEELIVATAKLDKRK